MNCDECGHHPLDCICHRDDSCPIQQTDIYELHMMRLKWFQKKGYNQATMMSYLMNEFVGTLAGSGYSEKFVEATFCRMFDLFKNHHLRIRQKEKK